MKKIALPAVAAHGLAILPGCQLLFLPCYVCASCAGGGSVAVLGPTQQTRALAVAH